MSDDSESAVPGAKKAPSARQQKIRKQAKGLAQGLGQDWKSLTPEERKGHKDQARAEMKAKRKARPTASE